MSHCACVSCRGNALRQGSAWRGSRGLVALLLFAVSVCGAAVWLYVTFLDSDVTETLVRQGELVSPRPRFFPVQCSEDYDNHKRYPGEAPLHFIRWSADTSLLCKYDRAEIKPRPLDKKTNGCWILTQQHKHSTAGRVCSPSSTVAVKHLLMVLIIRMIRIPDIAFDF